MTRSLFLLAALVSLLLASPAWAQSDADRARAHEEFERGVAAYTAHDYTTALDAFQEAYRLAPHASVRLNIANCYDQLDRPIEALFHFEHYLTEATGLTAAQRREVQASIDRLEARVGTIVLAVTPDGAAIVIDGGDTRRAPMSEPVRVVAGDHVVDISLDGYVAEHQTVHVEGGGSVRISIRLRRAEVASGGSAGAATGTGTATATTETTTVATTETTTVTDPVEAEPVEAEPVVVAEPPESAPVSSNGGGFEISLPTWIAGGVTVAAAIGWAIAGGIAISANNAFEDDVYNSTLDGLSDAERAMYRNDGLAHADQARSAALAADILMVTTIVGAGATTFFLVLDIVDGGSDEPEATAVVVPVVSPDFVGGSVAGTF